MLSPPVVQRISFRGERQTSAHDERIAIATVHSKIRDYCIGETFRIDLTPAYRLRRSRPRKPAGIRLRIRDLQKEVEPPFR